MKCPHTGNEVDSKLCAKALGSEGGKAKKHFTPQEKQRRKDRMAIARQSRWPQKPTE